MTARFDGKPCKHGHGTLRYVATKACVECARRHGLTAGKKWQLKNEERERARGLAYREKNRELMREKDRARYAADPAGHNAKYKAWREANLDHDRQRHRDYHAANFKLLREKARSHARKERTANPEAVRERDRARWAANKEKMRAQCRKRYAVAAKKMRLRAEVRRREDPARYRALAKARRDANPDMLRSYLATRRARQLKAEGDYTPADVAKLRAEQDDRCVYCRVDLARKGHVDHIIPLSKGGSNWPSNLQLLCRSCNSKKGAKHPDEFAKIIGFDVRRAGHASQR